MLSAELNRRLDGIADASMKGYPIRNLYRLMYEEELWIEAYAKIYANDGAMTKGVDDITLDGFSRARVAQIIQGLREGTYEPKPVRRENVRKLNGKMRPLGIPNGDDKLAQEVARMILERVYEPIFSDRSHGFRSGKSCHTALSEIRHLWTGTKWLIDVDVKGFFDNIDHKKLLKLLEKKVDDKRFVHLIEQWLQAGYVDDWKFNRTYSGTPQGGIISPILANVYLNELDQFMKGLKGSFDAGEERKSNPEYSRLQAQIRKCKQQIAAIRNDPSQKGRLAQLQDELEKKEARRSVIPKRLMDDPDYRRLNYCRYADDFVIGVIGSQEDAVAVMEKVKNFLARELLLETNEDKTHISHIEDGCKFLSYVVKAPPEGKEMFVKSNGKSYKTRTMNGRIGLYVPEGKAEAFCLAHGYGDYKSTKAQGRPYLTVLSELEIVETFNSELRGLAQYYALASNVKIALTKLFFIALESLMRTIGHKRQISAASVYRMLSVGDGYAVRYEIGGVKKERRVYRLKDLERRSYGNLVDRFARPMHLKHTGTELVRRLNARRCEFCGSAKECEVHHVRKLKDIANKRNKSYVELMMIARKRKTMVLCAECHDRLHAGTLPDLRYSVIS